MITRCENCRHVGLTSDNRGGEATICQRHPPVIVDAVIERNLRASIPTFTTTDLRVASAWPATDPKTCCGEWESRSRAKPPRRSFREILRERHGGAA